MQENTAWYADAEIRESGGKQVGPRQPSWKFCSINDVEREKRKPQAGEQCQTPYNLAVIYIFLSYSCNFSPLKTHTFEAR